MPVSCYLCHTIFHLSNIAININLYLYLWLIFLLLKVWLFNFFCTCLDLMFSWQNKTCLQSSQAKCYRIRSNLTVFLTIFCFPLRAIKKYSLHAGILNVKENIFKDVFSFQNVTWGNIYLKLRIEILRSKIVKRHSLLW